MCVERRTGIRNKKRGEKKTKNKLKKSKKVEGVVVESGFGHVFSGEKLKAQFVSLGSQDATGVFKRIEDRAILGRAASR